MLLDLSNGLHYDIAAALRGPDYEDGYLWKEALTARLRAIAGGPDRVAAAFRNYLLSEPTLVALGRKSLAKWPESERTHYFEHLRLAFMACRALGIGDFEEVQYLEHSAYHAAMGDLELALHALQRADTALARCNTP